MNVLDLQQQIIIICGHYGVGKTNFSLNLARTFAEAGRDVYLADMDIVNPYFRSGEYADMLSSWGVRCVAPVYGYKGTSLDLPSLSPEVYAAFEALDNPNAVLIMDVGGDEVGATVLCRFVPYIRARHYCMLYVINALRNLTSTADEAYDILRLIQDKTGLQASYCVNNTHLMDETTPEIILDSFAYVRDFAEKSALPCLVHCVPENVRENVINRANEFGYQLDGQCTPDSLYPIEVIVKKPWEV